MSKSTRLPPLPLLQAFEAAARLGSFTAAARELDSTQPAISQHVKRLEADLGGTLFDRGRSGVRLTRLGQHLLPAVADGLERLVGAWDEAHHKAGNAVINVATDFALAAYWILPRLRHFRARHPGVDVRLITSQQHVLPDQANVDIALLFARGEDLPAPSRLFFPEAVTPVASPTLLTNLGLPATAASLTHVPLLQLEADHHADWFDWPGLFGALGLEQSPREAELIFNNYTLLLQAAISGQGAAIGWSPFIEPMLETGALVALTERPLGSDQGYHLVFPTQRAVDALVLELVDWLQEESRATERRDGTVGRR